MTGCIQRMTQCRVLALAISFLAAPILLCAVPAQAQDGSFKAVVVQDHVKVLAGARRQYYEVGTLKKGDVVQVHQVLYGWNVIVPPKGFYSYITQADVDTNGKGNQGVVNADNAKVTAGNVKGPALSYREQTTLDKGTKVTILGKEGSYYKIVPPEGAYVYLPPGSVRRVALEKKNESGNKTVKTSTLTPAPAPTPTPKKKVSSENSGNGSTSSNTAKPVKPQTGTATSSAGNTGKTGEKAGATTANTGSKKAEQSSTQVAATQGSGESSKQTKTAKKTEVKTPAISPALRKVEMKELPLFAKPISDQPLAKMKAAYEAVSKDASLPALDKQIVQIRLAMIAHNQQIANTLASINQVKSSVDAAEKAESEAAKKAAAHPQPVHYDLVGRLEASSVYDGSSLPMLYRIVDQDDNTLAYVRPTKIDARKMLGRIVGAVGKRSYNSALKLNIFQVKRIDVLSAQSGK